MKISSMAARPVDFELENPVIKGQLFNQTWVRAVLLLGNAIVFIVYSFFPAFVLLVPRQEVLTGSAYELHPDVFRALVFLLVVSLLFAISVVGTLFGRGRIFRVMIVVCLVAFSVAETYETVMVHIVYGPISPRNISAYALGPILLMWAIFNWFGFVRRRE